ADAAFERLLRATAEPAADDAGALRVRSELVDGALTLRFLAERRGATSVRTLLLDSGATFGAGLRRVYGLDEADLPLALAAWRAQRLDAR
ncbi:MAG TPA: hypothetical protein VEI02_15775, partial [Planctomycetota bacterium]|nr:hypothetical protein [Planctomycetota bacterium]